MANGQTDSYGRHCVSEEGEEGKNFEEKEVGFCNFGMQICSGGERSEMYTKEIKEGIESRRACGDAVLNRTKSKSYRTELPNPQYIF
jgi:hypothetical protein